MEPLKITSTADEAVKRTEPWFHLPAVEDRGLGQSSGPHGMEGQSASPFGADHTHRHSVNRTRDWNLQELEFQDSRQSPALALLPEFDFSDYSLFQQTDVEFAPLRGCPDVSLASERSPQAQVSLVAVQPPAAENSMSQHSLGHNTTALSDHPFGHASTQSEEGASCSYSLSEHSMPLDEAPLQEDCDSAKPKDEKGMVIPRCGTDTVLLDPKGPLAMLAEDNTSFCIRDPATQLPDQPQKVVDMQSGSSASEVPLIRTSSFGGESRPGGCDSSKPEDVHRGTESASSVSSKPPPTTGRYGPQGGGERTEQQVKSRPSSRVSEVSNITIRSQSSPLDDSCDVLHRQLCSEVKRSLNPGPVGPVTQEKARHGHSLDTEARTPGPVGIQTTGVPSTGSSKGRLSVTRGLLAGVAGPGFGSETRLSAGFSVERGHRERDLWSSGNQTGVEPNASFLGVFPQPVSQSTPGVFLHAPVSSPTSIKPNVGQPSAITSYQETGSQNPSSSGASSQPQSALMSQIDDVDPATPCREAAPLQKPSGRSHPSLPSLTYLQKVDAWRANQSSSSKTSLYDSLSLQGFSRVTTKQKAHNAISGSLNLMLSPPHEGHIAEPQSQQQLPMVGSYQQALSLSASGPPSPTGAEAAGRGSAPIGREDPAGPLAGTLPSPLGRSQSYSSLSTVVTSIQTAQRTQKPTDPDRVQTDTQTETRAASKPGLLTEAERRLSQTRPERMETVERRSAAPARPSDISLGCFSDVSSNRDYFSNSQDSGHSMQNFGASVGPSSVLSLEVDNYAPYWSSKPHSPHKEMEPLNIEDRIPMYLHNLGIDQSPSTILTPFVPRGPIREPEFSPTDFCTIKGSTATGTPTKSAQPSEGDSPYKEEFTRSSSKSLPVSVDSLHLPHIRTLTEKNGVWLAPDPNRDRSPSLGSLRLALSTLDTSLEGTDLQDSLQDSHYVQPSIPEPLSGQPRYTDWPPDPHQTDHSHADNTVGVSSQVAAEIAERLGSSSDSLSRNRDQDSLDKDSLFRDRDSLDKDSDGLDRDNLSRYRAQAVGSCPQVNIGVEQSKPDDSFVGSQTLQDIRRLLGRAEDLVSGGSSSDDDTLLLSLKRELGTFQDYSCTSSSSTGDGEQEPGDSGRLAERRRDTEREKDSEGTRESDGTPLAPERPSPTKAEHRTTRTTSGPSPREESGRPQRDTERYGSLPWDGSAGATPSTSVLRAEPEGCSAAPPATPAAPSPRDSQPHRSLGGEDEAEGDPAGSDTSPSCAGGSELEGGGQSERGDGGGALSDGGGSSSSGSSLAARVARLLQKESTDTAGSLSSTADLEESRAREWLRMKVSGQQCEPLELNTQDRLRIEEIKRELLLKHPLKSQMSTDTESSLVSSIGGPRAVPAELFSREHRQGEAQRAAEDRPSQQLRRPHRSLFDSGVEMRALHRRDLEEHVGQIAQREGFPLPRLHPPNLTSITISTLRRSSPPDPTPEPLQVSHPPSDRISHREDVGQQHQTQPQVEESTSTTSTDGRDQTSTTLTHGRDQISTTLTHGRDLTSTTLTHGRESTSTSLTHGRDSTSTTLTHSRDLTSTTLTHGRDSTSTTLTHGRDSTSTTLTHGRDLTSTTLTHGRDPTSTTLTHGQDVTSTTLTQDGDPTTTLLKQGDGRLGQCGSSPPRTGQDQVSHLHITLSPKGAEERTPSERALSFAPLQSPDVPGFVEVHRSPSNGFEPVSAYRTHSQDAGEPIGRPERKNVSADLSPECFTPPQQTTGTGQFRSAALPVLLPYKPHGSEMFYVPQNQTSPSDTPLSPGRSDTTVESSHPGSDDAVPPRFNVEILGSRDQPVDRGVHFRHSEGIYSKRLRLGDRNAWRPGYLDYNTPRRAVSVDEGQPMGLQQHAVSTTATRGPAEVSRDQGTLRSTSTQTQGVPDPGQPTRPPRYLPEPAQLSSHPPRPSFGSSLGDDEQEEFRPLHVEIDCSSMDHDQPLPPTDRSLHKSHPLQPSDPRTAEGRGRGPGGRDHSLAGGASLDQLWRRFSERWSLHEARPVSERETSLLERLERLSHLIHSMDAGLSTLTKPDARQQTTSREDTGLEVKIKSRVGVEGERWSRREERRLRDGNAIGDQASGNQANADSATRFNTNGPRQAWEYPKPAEEYCSAPRRSSPPNIHCSSPSHGISSSQHLCPAERDESESISGETNTSLSTVDTARLVRAFGPQRVRILKTGGNSLSQLYSAIHQQRRGRPPEEAPQVPLVSNESTGSDDSMVTADSTSSFHTFPLPPHRGPSHSHQGPPHSRKPVKLVNKGIQAGDLEIVCNGTRRHTRDVGTTFPSPSSVEVARETLSLSSRGGDNNPLKSQVFPEAGNPNSSRHFPKRRQPGVSWHVPVDDQRAEGRKENQPVSDPPRARFEPCSRTRPWRRPLRQRHIQGPELDPLDRLQTSQNNTQPERGRPSQWQQNMPKTIHPPGPESISKALSALVPITLQEALELRRPEFVSRSRERVKRLALQVEDRKLQTVFSRERNELFNPSEGTRRLFKPAETAVLKRAVTKKEMVQRSKQMYEQLPEVQRRKEEARRRAEYNSYRLNAQLYNKRVTNRVLGRRTAWQ